MADFSPTHPGEVLRHDFLEPLGMSQYALAKALDVPQMRISDIVNGKRDHAGYGPPPCPILRRLGRVLAWNAADLRSGTHA